MFVFSLCRHVRFSCLVYLPLMIAVTVFVTFTIGTYTTVVDNIADYDVIQNISSVVTYTDCYMRCERNPACTHFVLNKGNHSVPRCSLLMLNNLTNATDLRGSRECKQEKEEKWKRIELVKDETLIVKDTLVKTIPKVTKEYVLSIDLRITSRLTDDTTNILHLTTGKFSGDYGSRTPLIGLRKGGLFTRSAVNNKLPWGAVYESSELFELNKWTTIQIKQIKDADTSTVHFIVLVDNKEVNRIKNEAAEEFNDVKCYLSNPWDLKQPGYVRNVWIDILR